jgi:hypothetical protein
MEPAQTALSVVLFGLAGFFLLATVPAWAKLARHRERPNEIPAIPAEAFRSAASMTAATLALLGVALIVFAVTLL